MSFDAVLVREILPMRSRESLLNQGLTDAETLDGVTEGAPFGGAPADAPLEAAKVSRETYQEVSRTASKEHLGVSREASKEHQRVSREASKEHQRVSREASKEHLGVIKQASQEKQRVSREASQKKPGVSREASQEKQAVSREASQEKQGVSREASQEKQGVSREASQKSAEESQDVSQAVARQVSSIMSAEWARTLSEDVIRSGSDWASVGLEETLLKELGLPDDFFKSTPPNPGITAELLESGQVQLAGDLLMAEFDASCAWLQEAKDAVETIELAAAGAASIDNVLGIVPLAERLEAVRTRISTLGPNRFSRGVQTDVFVPESREDLTKFLRQETMVVLNARKHMLDQSSDDSEPWTEAISRRESKTASAESRVASAIASFRSLGQASDVEMDSTKKGIAFEESKSSEEPPKGPSARKGIAFEESKSSEEPPKGPSARKGIAFDESESSEAPPVSRPQENIATTDSSDADPIIFFKVQSSGKKGLKAKLADKRKPAKRGSASPEKVPTSTEKVSTSPGKGSLKSKLRAKKNQASSNSSSSDVAVTKRKSSSDVAVTKRRSSSDVAVTKRKSSADDLASPSKSSALRAKLNKKRETSSESNPNHSPPNHPNHNLQAKLEVKRSRTLSSDEQPNPRINAIRTKLSKKRSGSAEDDAPQRQTSEKKGLSAKLRKKKAALKMEKQESPAKPDPHASKAARRKMIKNQIRAMKLRVGTPLTSDDDSSQGRERRGRSQQQSRARSKSAAPPRRQSVPETAEEDDERTQILKEKREIRERLTMKRLGIKSPEQLMQDEIEKAMNRRRQQRGS
ncbi:MAG: hypothetical protein KVP17_003308 [Porospora cf. gigantea B]|uniref:uncharacterized protein n=1 Tax=Porospora cf. gigantea B TaxID=2853592 RepID=UPI003571C511|nr:MAG: hypothetical protein KVP17_003308 [Porospora cf. gigantea B]